MTTWAERLEEAERQYAEHAGILKQHEKEHAKAKTQLSENQTNLTVIKKSYDSVLKQFTDLQSKVVEAAKTKSEATKERTELSQTRWTDTEKCRSKNSDSHHSWMTGDQKYEICYSATNKENPQVFEDQEKNGNSISRNEDQTCKYEDFKKVWCRDERGYIEAQATEQKAIEAHNALKTKESALEAERDQQKAKHQEAGDQLKAAEKELKEAEEKLKSSRFLEWQAKKRVEESREEAKKEAEAARKKAEAEARRIEAEKAARKAAEKQPGVCPPCFTLDRKDGYTSICKTGDNDEFKKQFIGNEACRNAEHKFESKEALDSWMSSNPCKLLLPANTQGQVVTISQTASCPTDAIDQAIANKKAEEEVKQKAAEAAAEAAAKAKISCSRRYADEKRERLEMHPEVKACFEDTNCKNIVLQGGRRILGKDVVKTDGKCDYAKTVDPNNTGGPNAYLEYSKDGSGNTCQISNMEAIWTKSQGYYDEGHSPSTTDSSNFDSMVRGMREMKKGYFGNLYGDFTGVHGIQKNQDGSLSAKTHGGWDRQGNYQFDCRTHSYHLMNDPLRIRGSGYFYCEKPENNCTKPFFDTLPKNQPQ